MTEHEAFCSLLQLTPHLKSSYIIGQVNVISLGGLPAAFAASKVLRRGIERGASHVASHISTAGTTSLLVVN